MTDTAPGGAGYERETGSGPERAADRTGERYLVVIEPAGNGYSGYSPDLAGCVTTGDTIEEVERRMREEIERHLRSLREHGRAPPTPRSLAIFIAVRC